MLTSNQIRIGMLFNKRGTKRNDLCKVIDILKTYNSKDELVKTSYLCTHIFMGQLIQHEECATTIMRGHEP